MATSPPAKACTGIAVFDYLGGADLLPQRRATLLARGPLGEPGRALADGIFMTPTPLRPQPVPLRRIAGSPGDTATLMQAPDLPQLGTQVLAKP